MRGFLTLAPHFLAPERGVIDAGDRRRIERDPVKTRRNAWLLLGVIAALATLSIAVSVRSAASKPLQARPAAENAAQAQATGAVASPSGFRQIGEPERRSRTRRDLQSMREGGGVRPPYGFERFCKRDRAYCAPPKSRRPGATVTASRDLIERLAAFNRSVNAEFEPSEDKEIYGVSDHWTFPTLHADCEDYVLVKQARLLKAGWPREALLIGVVVGEQSPFHAVLIVRTTKGELVLDNMSDELLDWRDTGYTFVIRQSAETPERWVRVLPASDAADG